MGLGSLGRLLGLGPKLPQPLRERLQRLRALPEPATTNPHALSRYVTVDVETSGLDMFRDRVLSIGAVAIDHGRIDLAQCFYVVLRQAETSSHDNILVHRIGGQKQLSGIDPAEAVLQFLEFVGKAPLVAYRAEFDRTFLDRAARHFLGVRTPAAWIDLAKLLPVVYPNTSLRVMDDWLRHLKVRMVARHDALADALATAQMLMKCLPLADERQLATPGLLLELERAQHWLGRN